MDTRQINTTSLRIFYPEGENPKGRSFSFHVVLPPDHTLTFGILSLSTEGQPIKMTSLKIGTLYTICFIFPESLIGKNVEIQIGSIAPDGSLNQITRVVTVP